MNDLIIREIGAGALAVLGFCVTLTFIVHVVNLAAREIKTGNQWYQDRGVQGSIALSFFFLGDSIRAGWIWLVLSCENHAGGDCVSIRRSYFIFITSLCFALIGELCCMRVFSRRRWGHWLWLVAGVAAIGVPVLMFLFPPNW